MSLHFLTGLSPKRKEGTPSRRMEARKKRTKVRLSNRNVKSPAMPSLNFVIYAMCLLVLPCC